MAEKNCGEKLQEPEKNLDLQCVVDVFVKNYYAILENTPDIVHRFYQDRSVIMRQSRPDGGMESVTTTQNINDTIMSSDYKGCSAEILNADFQESLNGGIIVFVNGYLIVKDTLRKRFCQTFFLARQERGFYVLNDILRLLTPSACSVDTAKIVKEPAMSNFHFPEDLLLLVLGRLPIKSVCRFKTVSKPWNTLISSQEFIKLNLNQSRIDQKPNILVYGDVLDKVEGWLSRQIHFVESSISTIGENLNLGCKIQRLHHPFERTAAPWLVNTRIIGCCNGLLCVIRDNPKYGYDISLCNPITSSSYGLRYNDHQKKRKTIHFYGFGYDDVHDDYKVMIATNHDKYPEYAYNVYSWRSDSWTTERSYLSYLHVPAIGVSSFAGVLSNCALHWIFFDRDNNNIHSKTNILAFDLKTAKHRFISLPDVLEKTVLLRLGVLNNGSLVLTKGFHDHYDIWVMKDYGLNDSWTKITIQNMPKVGFSFTPIAFMENNNGKQIMFHNFEEGTILLYDLESRQILKHTTNPVPGFFYFPFVASFVQPFFLAGEGKLN